MQILTRNYPKFYGLSRPDPTRKNWAYGLTRPGPTRGRALLPDPTRGSKISDPQHPYDLLFDPSPTHHYFTLIMKIFQLISRVNTYFQLLPNSSVVYSFLRNFSLVLHLLTNSHQSSCLQYLVNKN